MGGAIAGAAAADIELGGFAAQCWTLRLEWDPLIVPAATAAASRGFTDLPLTYAVLVDDVQLLSTVATTATVRVSRVALLQLTYNVRVIPSFGSHACEASPVVTVALGQVVTFRLWGAGGSGGMGVDVAAGAGGFAEGKYLLMPGEKLSVTVGEAGSTPAAAIGGGGRGCSSSGYTSGGGGGASFITSSSRENQVLLGAGGGGGGASYSASGGGGGGTLGGRIGAGGNGGPHGHGPAPTAGSSGGGGGGGTHSHSVPVTAGGASGGSAGCFGGHANGAGGQGYHSAGGGGGGAASHMHLIDGSFRAINATGHAAVVVPEAPGVAAGGCGKSGRNGSAGLAIIILPDGGRKTFDKPGVYEFVYDP